MDVEFYENVVTEEDFLQADADGLDFLQADADGDGSLLEGERCGICMDIVIDRGVLDCCQHWFCFACIDNWSTITNLCPLCQNEFQLITCVPVYDTIGSNKADEGSFSRDDDWSVEGKNSTLSFPSYCIDENAVTCLDGNGCKIRSESVTLDENSSLDTSIACDSCDIWYHAFCVGFDPEGAAVELWLCPRCLVDEAQGSDIKSWGTVQHQNHLENYEHQSVDTFSGKVSVSVADDGETAMVVSVVDQKQCLEGPTEGAQTTMGFDNEYTISPSVFGSVYFPSKPEEEAGEQIENPQPNAEATADVVISLHHNSKSNVENATMCTSSIFEESEAPPTDFHESLTKSELKDDLLKMGTDQGSSVACFSPDDLDSAKGIQEVHLGGNCSVDEHDVKDDFAARDHNRRKCKDHGGNVCTRDQKKFRLGTEACTRKIKSEEDVQRTVVADEHLEHDSEKVPASDIMSIVQDTGSRVMRRNQVDKFSKGKMDISGLRVKKIVRRPVEDKESSLLVQKLRKEIREAVRNKSSENVGKAIFDPKLLAAFRAAVSVPEAEPVKKVSPLVVKAKNVILQKGKTRENLTKKIYATSSGKRKHDWHRHCEVEFWKHRCVNKVSKPEKIETLKSVLNLLKMGPDTAKWEQSSEEEARNSILSRLYLADASVFPRKDIVKPLSALQGSTKQEAIQVSTSGEKEVKLSSDNCHTRNQASIVVPSQSDNSSAENRKNKNPPTSLKARVSSNTSADSTGNSQNDKTGKPDEVKIDKRKWALEVLARKAATNSTRVVNQKQKDNNQLKGIYPLLAELPGDMRPKLEPGRHNKISISVRQPQLYRLAEHFLKLTNVSPMRRTGATELAVADAINIEKEVARKSNSKVVYLNLISQELRCRTSTTSSHTIEDSIPSTSSIVSPGGEDLSMPSSPPSLDADIEKALKNAGLLFDSPPNSPNLSAGNLNEGIDSFLVAEEEDEGSDNLLEMNPNSELDIYGDFDYDLDDEDYIGASAMKASNLKTEEGVESKVKVVFSTLDADRSNPTVNFENPEIQYTKDDKVDCSCLPPESTDEDGDKDPTLEECEELYGPDKEPLSMKFPTEITVSQNLENQILARGTVPSSSEDECAKVEPRSCNNVNIQSGASGRINPTSSSSLSSENKKISQSVDKEHDVGDSIVKKVEAYIKEHIRPLCKTGIITVDQYKWAVAKTANKVMKYHSKAKNANFLIKEGEKVKKLAEQYVEAAQRRQESK